MVDDLEIASSSFTHRVQDTNQGVLFLQESRWFAVPVGNSSNRASARTTSPGLRVSYSCRRSVDRQAAGRPVDDDARDGVAAAVVSSTNGELKSQNLPGLWPAEMIPSNGGVSSAPFRRPCYPNRHPALKTGRSC